MLCCPLSRARRCVDSGTITVCMSHRRSEPMVKRVASPHPTPEPMPHESGGLGQSPEFTHYLCRWAHFYKPAGLRPHAATNSQHRLLCGSHFGSAVTWCRTISSTQTERYRPATTFVTHEKAYRRSSDLAAHHDVRLCEPNVVDFQRSRVRHRLLRCVTDGSMEGRSGRTG